MSLRRPVVALVAALLISLPLCPRALADADPASDVLLGENVFYPYNPAVSSGLQAALNGEVAQAHRAGFPLKVALIASPVDLGALPTFFRRPQQYAAFLDQEISFGSRVPLLVVMPDGYGVAGVSASARATVASLARPATPTSNGLAQAATQAVRRLASGTGHPIGSEAAHPRAAGGGSRVVLPVVILGLVCGGLAAAIVLGRRRRGSRRAAAPPQSRRRQ